jgi:hypothetical protein
LVTGFCLVGVGGQQIFCAILRFFGNKQNQEQKSKSRAVFKKQKRATI